LVLSGENRFFDIEEIIAGVIRPPFDVSPHCAEYELKVAEILASWEQKAAEEEVCGTRGLVDVEFMIVLACLLTAECKPH
jgi:hypothetical protein